MGESVPRTGRMSTFVKIACVLAIAMLMTDSISAKPGKGIKKPKRPSGDGKCHLSPEEVGELVSELGPCMADVDEVTTDIVMPGEEQNVDSEEDMEEGEEERFFGGFFCTNYCAGPCAANNYGGTCTVRWLWFTKCSLPCAALGTPTTTAKP